MSANSNSERRLLLSVALGLHVLGLPAGCSKGPERVAVSGQVLIDGQPLTTGTVSFMPVAGGRPAGGKLDEQGRFTLTSLKPGDGTMLGEYNIAVSAVEYQGEVAQKWHAPKKYADARTSGLTVNVAQPEEDVKLELSWEGGKPYVERLR